jgi:magnesium chelatase family protein
MSLSKVLSCAVNGLDAQIVEVETDLAGGFLGITIVGLPDAAVRESRDRVMAAIKNSKIDIHRGRITVNMAPADIKKEGPDFDLPIAVGILASQGEVREDQLDEVAFIGELSLDGGLRPVKGVLPVCLEAKKSGIKAVILPKENADEGALVEGLSILPAENLNQIINFLNTGNTLKPHAINVKELFAKQEHVLDFKDVKGQQQAKRALEISAAGRHSLLMVGSPGSGKTMLSKRLPTILPPLSMEEALEITKIYSVAGLLNANKSLITVRPFRSPHHTVSFAGLVGGGSNPQPGEISMAHFGVLFLDEFPEFKRDVLEVLRQPIEEGKVTISRATSSVTFPARFMLVAAMNPCPCGKLYDEVGACSCIPNQIQRYWAKLSGPLLDRIDLQIEVPRLKPDEISSYPNGESSAQIAGRVERAYGMQLARFDGNSLSCNANMTSRQIRQFCVLDQEAQNLLKSAIIRLKLSARAYDRILKVSRTIADLEGAEVIKVNHVAEATQYRSLERGRQ